LEKGKNNQVVQDVRKYLIVVSFFFFFMGVQARIGKLARRAPKVVFLALYPAQHIL
jgi:hypothetical protein